MSAEKRGRRPTGALAVAAGIFASRLLGLARERVFAHYLGTSAAAGAFRAAMRIPNVLQNLFGEGALSASFIPVYARLLAEGKDEEAARVAGTVFSLLAVVVIALSTGGVLAAGLLADILAPGLDAPTRALAAGLIRIMFPGVGMLVMSAWCLGVLNSHRKFFTSYAAPVLWNLAIITSLTAFGATAFGRGDDARLSELAAYGTLVGSALQLLVQIPFVMKLVKGKVIAWDPASPQVRRILRTFGPALMSRGVVQISAWFDQILASFLGGPVIAAINYAQTLYTLPFSLIGTSMAAAELTEMAQVTGNDQTRARLAASMERIAFFMAPAVLAFLVLGDVVVATLFQTGRFKTGDVPLVHAILAAMALGLSASARTRLVSSAFWSLHDTRTPLIFATIRIALAGALGWVMVMPARAYADLTADEAAAGLALASACGALVENALSTRRMRKLVGPFTLTWKDAARPWGSAVVAAAVTYPVSRLTAVWSPVPRGIVVLTVFGALYLALTVTMRVPSASALVTRFRRRKKA